MDAPLNRVTAMIEYTYNDKGDSAFTLIHSIKGIKVFDANRKLVSSATINMVGKMIPNEAIEGEG